MEQAHHIDWLRASQNLVKRIESAQQQVTADVRKELAEGLRTCDAVLEQNPQSELATDLRARLLRLLDTPSAEASSSAGADQPETTIDPELIPRFDRLIAATESKFAQLGVSIEEAARHETHVPEGLLMPFGYVKNNAGFPQKNGVAMRLQALSQGGEISMMMRSGMFFYDALPKQMERGRHRIIAAFHPRYRRLQLPENYDPACLLDLFCLYHEIWHARQNDWLRATSDQADMLNERDAVIRDFEWEAYAHMLEAIHVYSHGELRQRCTGGATPKTTAWLCRLLGVREGNNSTVKSLLKIAKSFFVPGYYFSDKATYPRGFAEEVNTRIPGKDVWQWDHSMGKFLPCRGP